MLNFSDIYNFDMLTDDDTMAAYGQEPLPVEDPRYLGGEDPYGEEPDPEPTIEMEPASEEPPPTSQHDKMKLTLMANEAMRREEEMAENLWRAQGKPEVTPEMARGYSVTPKQYGQIMPTSKGFMYMGTLEPPTGAPGSGYDRMLAAGMIKPPSERLTPVNPAWTPAYNQWANQQDMQAAIGRGVPPQQAFAQYGLAAMGGLTSGNQAALLRQQAAMQKKPMHVGNSLVEYDPVTGEARTVVQGRIEDPNRQYRNTLRVYKAKAEAGAKAIEKTDPDNSAALMKQAQSYQEMLDALDNAQRTGWDLYNPNQGAVDPNLKVRMALADLANKIQAANPTWSNERVLSEAKKQLLGK